MSTAKSRDVIPSLCMTKTLAHVDDGKLIKPLEVDIKK